jgi:hypothetical protein
MNSPQRSKVILVGMLLSTFLACSLQAADQFTPVLVSPLNPNAGAFLGTDGKQHVVYELELLNANPTPATLEKIEVLDAANPAHEIASYQGAELVSRLRTVGKTPVANQKLSSMEHGSSWSMWFLKKARRFPMRLSTGSL